MDIKNISSSELLKLLAGRATELSRNKNFPNLKHPIDVASGMRMLEEIMTELRERTLPKE